MRQPWRSRGALAFALCMGLLLEALLFLAVRRFDLFTSEEALRDRAILLGLSIGFVVLSAQILHTIWGAGRISAMTVITLATMWAWAAVVLLIAFLGFLLCFALFFELYLPVRAAIWLVGQGLQPLKTPNR